MPRLIDGPSKAAAPPPVSYKPPSATQVTDSRLPKLGVDPGSNLTRSTILRAIETGPAPDTAHNRAPTEHKGFYKGGKHRKRPDSMHSFPRGAGASFALPLARRDECSSADGRNAGAQIRTRSRHRSSQSLVCSPTLRAREPTREELWYLQGLSEVSRLALGLGPGGLVAEGADGIVDGPGGGWQGQCHVPVEGPAPSQQPMMSPPFGPADAHPAEATAHAAFMLPPPPAILHPFPHPGLANQLPLPSPLALPPPQPFLATPEQPLPPLRFSFDPSLASPVPTLSYATPTHLAPPVPFTPSPFGPTVAALAASHALLATPAGRDAQLAALPFAVSPEPPLPSPMSLPGGLSRQPSLASSLVPTHNLPAKPEWADLRAPRRTAEAFYWPFVAYEGPGEVVFYHGPDAPAPLDLWERPDEVTRLPTAPPPGAEEEVPEPKEVAFELPLQISYAAALGFSRSRPKPDPKKDEADQAPAAAADEPPVAWAEPSSVLTPGALATEATVAGCAAVEAEEPPSPSPFRRASAQLVESPAMARTRSQEEAAAAGVDSSGRAPGLPVPGLAITVKLPSAAFPARKPDLKPASPENRVHETTPLVVVEPVSAVSAPPAPAPATPIKPTPAVVTFQEPEFILVERKKKEGHSPQASKAKKKAPLTPAPRRPSGSTASSMQVLGESRKASANAALPSTETKGGGAPLLVAEAQKKASSGDLRALQVGRMVRALTRVIRGEADENEGFEVQVHQGRAVVVFEDVVCGGLGGEAGGDDEVGAVEPVGDESAKAAKKKNKSKKKKGKKVVLMPGEEVAA